MVWIRIASNRFKFARNAFGGTIPALAFSVNLAVNLYQHGVVYRALKRFFDGSRVRLQSIARELNSVRETGRQVINEVFCGYGVPLAERPAWNQLRVGVNSGPGPDIPDDAVALHFFNGDLLLFASDE